MIGMESFTVVIQAGGQSSRMGQDKALMPFLGQPLIARQVARLRGLPASLLVITNDPDSYAFLGVPAQGDLLPGAGPLGGLYTALEASRTPALAVIACDMPFVQPRLLAAQHALLLESGADVVIPSSPDGRQPLHCVYRRSTCLPAVRAALEAGERKMIAWFSAVRVREMSAAEVRQHDPGFQAFINVNTPADFAEAEDLARSMGEG